MAQNFEGFEYRPVGKTPAQQNSANRDYYGQQPGVYATGTINHDKIANSKDTDIALLKQELDEFLTEEGQEPEHQDTNLIAAQ